MWSDSLFYWWYTSFSRSYKKMFTSITSIIKSQSENEETSDKSVLWNKSEEWAEHPGWCCYQSLLKHQQEAQKVAHFKKGLKKKIQNALLVLYQRIDFQKLHADHVLLIWVHIVIFGFSKKITICTYPNCLYRVVFKKLIFIVTHPKRLPKLVSNIYIGSPTSETKCGNHSIPAVSAIGLLLKMHTW